MPYSEREKIIVSHAKSDLALEKMRVGDGTAALISFTRDKMSGADTPPKGHSDSIGNMAVGAKEVADIAIQNTLRRVQAKPVFETINSELVAKGYPPLAENEKSYVLHSLLPSTTPPKNEQKLIEWMFGQIDDATFKLKDTYNKKVFGIKGFDDSPEGI